MAEEQREGIERTGNKYGQNQVVSGGEISISGQSLEQVSDYKYLGHEIRIDKDKQTKENQRRVGLEQAAFGKLSDTLRNKFETAGI